LLPVVEDVQQLVHGLELFNARFLWKVLNYKLVQMQETEMMNEIVTEELLEYPRIAGIQVGYNKSTLVGVKVSS